MSSLRHERVRELLKREIGEAIRREIPIHQAGLVSVNDVELGGDLKSATVFISILGDPDQQKRGLEMLTEQRARIQGLVARSVVLKYTPVLRFAIDESVVRGNKVLRIIEELERTSPSESQPED